MMLGNTSFFHTAWLLSKAGALRCAVLADTTAYSVLDRPRGTIDGAEDVSIATLMKRLSVNRLPDGALAAFWHVAYT